MQYKAGYSGGARVADSVGAGSEQFGKDGRTATGGWERGAPGLRKDGQKSILECWAGKGKGERHAEIDVSYAEASKARDTIDPDSILELESEPSEAGTISQDESQSDESKTVISTVFKNTTIYINGYTGPLVSDHRLRYLITQHGGKSSLGLARRSVTHVILGKRDAPADPSTDGGHIQSGKSRAWAGGSLAATKLQKELALSKVSGIKFVSAAWVLESIEAGRRLPESKYAEWAVGKGEKQKSVKDAFGMSKPGMMKDEKVFDGRIDER